MRSQPQLPGLSCGEGTGGGGIVGEEGPGGEEEDSENGRGNLIMRHLTVRGSPFRANPAKWRGWRQPNNQAVN
jgi:hypothetical protein